MARPLLHGEKMRTLTVYMPERLCVHPGFKTRSEMFMTLVSKYLEEYEKKPKGEKVVKPVVTDNSELKSRMEEFFKPLNLLDVLENDFHYRRFFKKYPDTDMVAFKGIMCEVEYQDNKKKGLV